jgi:hypothetical protein
MIEETLYARLKTQAANVYPLVAPKAYQRPCVVYNRVATEVVQDLDLDDGTDQKTFLTFQIDVYSESFFQAKTLARAIKKNLRQWRDLDVQAVAWTDEHSTSDTTTELTLFRVMMFFKLFCAD